jgi:hypothetical protein
MTGKIVPFSAVAKSYEERDISARVRRVIAEQSEAGFDCGENTPNLRFLSAKLNDSFTGQRVRYDSERKTIIFDLRAIRGISTPVTNQALLNQPNLTQAIVNDGGSGILFKPTTSTELTQLIARAISEHFVQVYIEHECKNGWVCKSDMESYEKLAADMIRGGVIEYLVRVSAPTSETVAENIWETYDEDPALKTQTHARQWFERCGGYSLVAPILDAHKMTGLRYLFENPLLIDRHFSLAQLPVYRAEALADLSSSG